MKLIKPSVEFYGAAPTDYESAIKFIEMAGRTCYKSEDKITETSAEGFVKKLINAGHLAMIEHSNFVVRTRRMDTSETMLQGRVGKYLTVLDTRDYTYIGGNLAAWFQLIKRVHYRTEFIPFVKQWGKLFDITTDAYSGDWEICPHNEIPKELHRYSAKFICNRAVSHELVRHRPCSFAQESQRYVNYGGKDMEFIEPAGFDMWSYTHSKLFYDSYATAENIYKKLLDPGGFTQGLKPQQARAVLPNAIKTEIVVTADIAEWKHIRALRTSKAADPEMQRVMSMMPWNKII